MRPARGVLCLSEMSLRLSPWSTAINWDSSWTWMQWWNEKAVLGPSVTGDPSDTFLWLSQRLCLSSFVVCQGQDITLLAFKLAYFPGMCCCSSWNEEANLIKQKEEVSQGLHSELHPGLSWMYAFRWLTVEILNPHNRYTPEHRSNHQDVSKSTTCTV